MNMEGFTHSQADFLWNGLQETEQAKDLGRESQWLRRGFLYVSDGFFFGELFSFCQACN